jgi:predicted CXXCH cytochrome family protein
MWTFKSIIYFCFLLITLIIAEAYGKGISDTKHNLSVSGPGPIKSTTEDRICIFCHAPERGRKNNFLWNRRDSRSHYFPYQSSTIFAQVGQPTGTSKLCLSCHDGTIAFGALLSVKREIPFKKGIRFMPEGRTRIGTFLSDDHPISFRYDSILAVRNGELADPSLLPKDIVLGKDSQMQCSTCHDAHDNTYGKFLVMSNSHSALCTTCHKKRGWNIASHSVSDSVWNGTAPDPWPNSDYTSVYENGCDNCHTSHSAGSKERLLNYTFEEDNCLVCHNGNIANKDIENELSKPYRHSVQDYNDDHDPAESFLDVRIRKHVECSDCHNPHMSNDMPADTPAGVSGALDGVKGIDLSGREVSSSVNQYEICFKCHADNNVIKRVEIDRDLRQLNARLEFSPLNPSFHPVTIKGVNLDVPSLRPEYTTLSIILCTDCHNNDDAVGPRGPHGSSNRFLLEKKYNTEGLVAEDYNEYALCYKCHDRDSILNDESFLSHRKHIVDEKASCSVCHDPHGISVTQGNSTNNSNLINFDTTIVLPDSQGRLFYEDTGLFNGRCFLKCHGDNHEPEEYP